MLNFVITLGLFPGLAVQKKFEIDFVWSSLIMILLYGLGDMTGKFLVKVKSSFNHTSIMYLLCSRLYFFFTVPILASGAANSDPLIDNDVFPFINIFMFSLSSGFVVSNIWFI